MQVDEAAQSLQQTAEHNQKRLINQIVRIGTFNVRSCREGEDGESQLTQLTRELRDLNIGMCGLQELRRPGSGQSAVHSGSREADWSILWSGKERHRQNGVGLIMDDTWGAALCAWEPVSDRLLEARFACNRKQTVTVVVAYSPTEEATGSTADAFYEQVQDVCTRAHGRGDTVLLLGDFNAAVGRESSSGYIGPWTPASEPALPSPNGIRLLSVAAISNLRVANTFFRHRPEHQFTHVHPAAAAETRSRRCRMARKRSVKDYILISANHMRSVHDCRAYRGFTWNSDHVMVAMTLRMSLMAPRPQRQRRQYDSTRLEDSNTREAVRLALRNRFALLEQLPEECDGQIAQMESDGLVTALVETAKEHLRPTGPRTRSGRPTLSRRTSHLMARRKAAHITWLGRKTPATRKARNATSRAADRAVRRDIQRHTDQQAKEAQRCLDRRDQGGWARITKLMAGQKKSAVMPMAMRDDSNQLQVGGAVEKVLTKHFAVLLGGDVQLSQETLNELEAKVCTYELARPQPDPEPDPPSLQEVHDCISRLRNAASPGEDLVDARLLKSCPDASAWLHRVITAVWKSEEAPGEWKSAMLVPIYKGKGARDTAENYRGISLLSIAGKVYAMVLMKRVRDGTDSKLEEAQSGFRQGRGTTDAIWTLRVLGAACQRKRQCFARVYVDFRKAYDSVNRDALWKVLRLYGVHPKLITLLKDLHSGSTAAVRVGGELGQQFAVEAGVRQGCVVASVLFNIFLDHVLKEALAKMPANCGVRIRRRSPDQSDTPAHDDGDSLMHVSLLQYADDLVLMAHDQMELQAMLKTLDEVANKYGLQINASKTEVQVQGNADGEPVLPLTISSGQVEPTETFRYLGSWVQNDGGMDKEINVRRGRAMGAMESYSQIWKNRKLRVSDKMAVYRTFVLPHFLYGCETWNCTQDQINLLESAHSSCLRRIVGVSVMQHHSLQWLYDVCKSRPLHVDIIQHTLRWLGHVMRMDESRLPRAVYNCVAADGSQRSGGQRMSHRRAHVWMLQKVGIASSTADANSWLKNSLFGCAQDRQDWRACLKALTIVSPPTQTPARTSARLAGAAGG